MKCSVSMYFINELSTSKTTIIPKPLARTTGIKLNKSRPPRIRTPRECTIGNPTDLMYCVTSSTCARSRLVPSCQRARYLLPVSWNRAKLWREMGRSAASNALQELQAGVCGGDRKKRKQKEIAAMASVRLVRGRRPLCCTYTCSTARTVWPAAGTERLLAGAGRNQQRYRWPGNTHTQGLISSSDKTSRTQNFNAKLTYRCQHFYEPLKDHKLRLLILAYSYIFNQMNRSQINLKR